MKYRKLDINDDYSFGTGNQDITFGTYAVGQAIKTRLKLLKGEWWENTEDGLPLFDDILGKTGTVNNITIADTYIKERILGTKDVTSIESFSSSFDSVNRSYSFNCSVNTPYGTITLTNTTI